MWEKRQTRPEEALTQGTKIRGVRDPAGFRRTARRLLPRPTEQAPGDNSSLAGETCSGVKEQIISKETSLLSQNPIELLKTQKQITWGSLGGRVTGLQSVHRAAVSGGGGGRSGSWHPWGLLWLGGEGSARPGQDQV